ncbi:hypothetical protein PYCCODRAFT_291317 [Trametes coccinea BRFM310]|uniref:Uncharacterized protein n=1 Tax=Trametes coccinea (strain BRFM310) TaxID=1353009 RepID=A0A1Y2IPQ3_TRAC3|nr:hypothetical protein PYCCODRAFT_291317 [Trametes coccinea BRFM310]
MHAVCMQYCTWKLTCLSCGTPGSVCTPRYGLPPTSRYPPGFLWVIAHAEMACVVVAELMLAVGRESKLITWESSSSLRHSIATPMLPSSSRHGMFTALPHLDEGSDSRPPHLGTANPEDRNTTYGKHMSAASTELSYGGVLGRDQHCDTALHSRRITTTYPGPVSLGLMNSATYLQVPALTVHDLRSDWDGRPSMTSLAASLPAGDCGKVNFSTTEGRYCSSGIK